MARPTMNRFVVPTLIVLGSLLLVFALNDPLSSIENHITSLKYKVRGEQKADSNIVIVYVDNEATVELGWPVRRNYYALMIRALTELKVKSVGIDVLFENASLEYPEYDQLLAHVVQESKNVVLSSYFRSQEKGPADAQLEDLDVFHFPQVAELALNGSELHVPLAALVQGAGGVGHANISGERDLPLFVAYGNGIVPSFGLELLRMFCGADRAGVSFSRRDAFGNRSTLSLKRNGTLLEISTTERAEVQLNFPGRISSFTLYPFLEVLKSYDALIAGRMPTIPVQNLKNKIVLVGIIAEGRAETVATPVDPRFPVVGLHAVFLDNALRSGFLHTTTQWLLYLLCGLLAFACASSVLLLNSSARIVIPGGVLATLIIISAISFMTSAYVLPIAPLIVVGFTATVVAFFSRHRVVHEQLKTALSEKDNIVAELRDKEARVAMLERDLVSFESNKSADRTNELLEEIRRHKAEIHALMSKKDDMEEAVVADPAVMSEMKNFEGIIYEAGGTMQPVIDFVAKIAGSDATVLILGESGTGKEMIARAIHKRSKRADKAFVAVNCGALSESLLESELFGHERGAFTGAVREKPGRFELADGGTIFLDEIGEVNEAFQLKLLRVLQEGEFERVGASKTTKVNVRVVAATNKDLKQWVKEKKFREDLFYRLNVLSIDLPSLKDRQNDIPLLINYFLQKENGGMKVSKNVLDTLRNHAWRGNIRELESVITRAVLMANADKRTMISMKDLSDDIVSAAKGSIAIEDQILESLREKGFSRSAISETADELGGLNRGTVAEYLRGVCLKAFVEHTYNRDETVRYISLSGENTVNDRVMKKLQEYLANIADAIDRSLAWETVKPTLKPKMKNLPQKYHLFLEQVAEAYYRGVWNDK